MCYGRVEVGNGILVESPCANYDYEAAAAPVEAHGLPGEFAQAPRAGRC